MYSTGVIRSAMTAEPSTSLESHGSSDVSSVSSSSRGYDRSLFVEDPPLSMKCPVCKLILRDPHLLSCCGAHICEVCIIPFKSSNTPCPCCHDDDYATLLNKQLKRRVAELRVRCSNDGCPWSGELLYMPDHMEKCEYTLKLCKHGCGEYLTEVQLRSHEKHECRGRPLDVQMESLNIKFTEKLQSMQVKHDTEVARLEKRITEMEKKHAKELAILHQQITALKESIVQQSHQTAAAVQSPSSTSAGAVSVDMYPLPSWCYPLPISTLVQPPCIFIMPKFNRHKSKNDHWFSQPFYTHHHGYKLCLRVNANGDGEGKGSYVSLFVYIMRGEYDEELCWPFYGELTLQLLNWVEDKGHIEKTLPLDESVPEQYNGRQVKYARGKGWGYQKFIAIDKLSRNGSANTQYLQDDKLCFRVLKAAVSKKPQ